MTVTAIGIIWLAFSASGLLIHHACADAPRNNRNWVDIAGYDSEGYLSYFVSPTGLFSINHRHPMIGVASAPIVTVGMMVTDRLGKVIGYQAVICTFALVGALSCWLLWLILKKTGTERLPRIAAIMLWLSFGHVWILAGIAESFNLSMSVMLGTLLMVLCKIRDVRAWLAASTFAGCITITNFIKPLVAWIVAADGWRILRCLRRRTLILFSLSAITVASACLIAICCKWEFVDGIGAWNGVMISSHEVTDFLPNGNSLTERLWLIWNAFWCEPMMLRQSVIGTAEILNPYDSALPHVIGAIVLALCAWSAIRNRHLPVVRAALAMISFDVILHVIIGWGIAEGQIYCGHWFWIIPLLISLLPPRTAFLTIGLAISIAMINLTIL